MSPRRRDLVYYGTIYLRRDKMRERLCLGCKFNRYNYPDDLTVRPDNPVPVDFCWYMLVANRKRCLNRR